MLAAVITWVTDHDQRGAANELVTDRAPITHPCIWSVRQLLRSGATVLVATAGRRERDGRPSRLALGFYGLREVRKGPVQGRGDAAHGVPAGRGLGQLDPCERA